VDFSFLSGTENANFSRFPALVQRRRMTDWGRSSIADADRIQHRVALSLYGRN
jgi:hypothetical protein